MEDWDTEAARDEYKTLADEARRQMEEYEAWVAQQVNKYIKIAQSTEGCQYTVIMV